MPEYIQAIAGGERPTLAKLESVPQFVPLLTKCWDKIQRNRPTFVEIIEDLHKIRADIFLRGYCPQAYKIWLRFWASCESVYYGGNQSCFLSHLFRCDFGHHRPN